MNETPLRTADELLAHRSFIRGLAGCLARDEALADDIAQQTWVAASKGAADRRGPLRPWLASIVRNGVRRMRRDVERRQRREALVAKEDRAPAAGDIVERLELERALAEAVMALPEQERAIVGLHFYDELPLREAARRLELPYSTARDLLERALATLRKKLSTGTPERRGLLNVIAGLKGRSSAGPIGAHPISRIGIAGAAALVLVVLAIAGWLDGSTSVSSEEAQPSSARSPAAVTMASEGIPDDPIYGQVSVVSRVVDTVYVQIDVGYDDGVEVGLELELFRDFGNQRPGLYLARCVVLDVLPAFCWTKVVLQAPGEEIEVGDRATTRL